MILQLLLSPLRAPQLLPAPGAQGYEAHVLEGGAETLLGRRIPFIHTEVGPVMMGGAGSNATAFLERFAQVRHVHSCQVLT